MTYLTVEEMRKNPDLIESVGRDKSGGTRFEGSTVPELALKYFRKDNRLLECGPVFGPFTKFLQDNGYSDVYAADFIDVLKFPDRSRVDFKLVDFNFDNLPYADNFFDGVMAWGLIEHLENPFHFIREINRVLKPDGKLIFSVPNVFHIISRLLFLKKGMFPRWNETNNHIFVLPRGVFQKTVLRYFDLVEEKYIKPRFQFLFFDKLRRFLPANQWFGDYVVYVLKKKSQKESNF